MLLLASAAALAAILGARASLLASAASSAWQQAVRQEVKAAAAVVEDIRFVYGDEAAQAYRVVQARVRGEEFRSAAQRSSGLARAVLLAEAYAQDQLVVALTGASEVAQDQRYAKADGGYDMGRRLADMRARYPDLVAIRPDDPQAEGDRLSRHALLDTAATIPIAVTFLFGSLAQAFPRLRRPFLGAATGFLGVAVAAAVAVELVT